MNFAEDVITKIRVPVVDHSATGSTQSRIIFSESKIELVVIARRGSAEAERGVLSIGGSNRRN